MRICLVGATGVLGRHTIPHLSRAGASVVALVRSDRAEAVPSPVARIVDGDLFDRTAVARAVDGCDAVLHLATRIPRNVRTGPGDWAENDRVRTEGTALLLDAAGTAGVRFYLQQSVTFLYGDHGEHWIDEAMPLDPAPPPILRSANTMERLVATSGLPHAILRGGAFYGRGTGSTEQMLEMVRRRRLPVVGDGAAYTSLIHVEDMARAVAAVTLRQARGIFNVVDDEPVRLGEFLHYAATLVGAPSPRHVPLWLARVAAGPAAALVRSQRVSNRRLRDSLGWAPGYPTYREGLQEVIHQR